MTAANAGVPSGLPTGTVTFLRSDVEGSMVLVRELGPRFDEVHAEHQALVRGVLGRHHGREVRTEGDAFLAAFQDARDAVRAAADIQRAIEAHPWPPQARLRLRIGLHAGSAHLAGDDYGGFEVNRAARIAALGSGGQIVLSDPVRALAAAGLPPGTALRDLGRHRLKGVTEPEHLFQLDVEGLRTSFPPLPGEPAAGNLAPRLTSFVGRQDELAALTAMLASSRLLTLTGPGGTGKTSLAVELARAAADRYRDGAWQVNLAGVGEPDLVRAAIAAGLELHDGPMGSAADRLREFLADRDLLLVLDNVEHLLEATPDVADLLRSAPGLTVVATSRAPLRISGEQEFPVLPLPTAATPEGGSAGELFVDRARAARPAFAAGPEERELVAEIVAALDGLPLGIELAAARVASLPLREIAARLGAQSPLPGTGPRDLPARHRTLHDTIGWSHDLLDPQAQRLFAQLSVFVGGFDLEQVASVCRTAGPDSAATTLDGVVALAEQSLLMPIPEAGGGMRYRMLETVRAYAAQRLRETGEAPALRRQHAQAYLALASAASPHYLRRGHSWWVQRLAADHANLRAAMLWALETGDAAFGMILAGHLWRYWVAAGHLVEGRDLMNRVLALEAAGAPTRERLAGLDAAGSLAYWVGDTQTTQRLYDEQLALAGELGDPVGQAQAAFNAGCNLFVAEERDAALQALDLAMQRFTQVGDEVGITRTAWMRSTALMWQRGAEITLSESHELRRRFRELGEVSYESMASFSIAWVAMMAGDLREGAAWALRSIRVGLPATDRAGSAVELKAFAVVLFKLGDPEGAAVMLGAFDVLCQRYGVSPPVAIDRLLGPEWGGELIPQALGEAEAVAAREMGGRMSLEEATSYLQERLDRLGIEPAEGA